MQDLRAKRTLAIEPEHWRAYVRCQASNVTQLLEVCKQFWTFHSQQSRPKAHGWRGFRGVVMKVIIVRRQCARGAEGENAGRCSGKCEATVIVQPFGCFHVEVRDGNLLGALLGQDPKGFSH